MQQIHQTTASITTKAYSQHHPTRSPQHYTLILRKVQVSHPFEEHSTWICMEVPQTADMMQGFSSKPRRRCVSLPVGISGFLAWSNRAWILSRWWRPYWVLVFDIYWWKVMMDTHAMGDGWRIKELHGKERVTAVVTAAIAWIKRAIIDTLISVVYIVESVRAL